MRRLMIVLLLAAFVVPASAQERRVTFCIKGGLNMASMSVSPDYPNVEDGNLMGFAAGAGLGFVFSPGTNLEVDVLYVRKGTHSEMEAQDGGTGQMVTMEQDTKLDYIVVAPMIRLAMQRQGISPYVLAGAEIGWLQSAKIHDPDGNNGMGSDGDLGYMYRDLDYGLTFGGGMEFPAGSSAFFFEARYALGLAEVQAEKYSYATKQKTRGVYLLGGMRF